jgi:fatty-acyl-CoA synthase
MNSNFTTLAALTGHHAASAPNKPAIRVDGAVWSYGDLHERVLQTVAALRSAGVGKGDRVGWLALNHPDYVTLMCACFRLGAVLVAINARLVAREIAYILSDAGIGIIVSETGFLPLVDEARATTDLKTVILLDAPFEHRPAFAEWIAGHAADDVMPAITPDDVALQLYTSGTTGFPKGATLSHHNILNNGFFVGEALRLKAGSRLCIPVPLYHCFGMVMGNLGCITRGATMVLPSEGFEPLAVLEAVSEERCEALYGVPTMFIAVLAHPAFDSFDLTCLRTGIMAGSPCPVEVMRQVIDRMHMPEVTIAYGMTETSPISFQSSCDDSLEARVSTVGRIQPHVEVKIVDEAGRIVPRGAPGELCTRGYSVMLGYWDDAERTDEALDRSGWMHTGDLATLDADGYCNIVGRIKDMVIRGGENVYPREIEEYLYGHPAVQDVQVIGVPDLRFGEELCAWIVLKPGEAVTDEEVRDFCRGQIAHYKIPRYIRFVEGFPTTVTGKVRKVEMRETMIAELDLKLEKTA